MEKGQKKISELFDGRKVFCVPSYQRSYAWEEKQLNDFLDDLKNQKIEKEYFLGTILFRQEEKEEEFDKIEIVDGQQRITTIIIFMKVLIDFLKGKGEQKEKIEMLEDAYIKYKNKIKLKMQEDDNEFFQTYILNEGENAKEFVKTPSQRRLLFAKEYFKRELSGFPSEELKVIRDKIEKSNILTYSVSDPSDAALIFETTNDRGKILTNLEKIKSFLMYKSYLAGEEISSNLIENICQRFGEIYRIIDKIHEQDLGIDEDSVLQYNFIGYEKWDKKRDYQDYMTKIKNKINDLLREDQIKTIEFIDEYSKNLKESYEFLLKILKDNSDDIRNLYILKRMGIFYPLLIKTYRYDESDDKKNFLKIARILEIFSFRILSLKFKRTNDVDTFLNSLAKEFNGNYVEIIRILKEKILEISPDNLFKNKLSSTNFYNEFANIDKNYLLWKYENYLRTFQSPRYSPMSEIEFTAKDKKYILSVEHIASQNPKVTTDNIKFEEMTDEFKENFLNRLGNLTFDPLSSNASKGNISVPEKNSKYFKKAPFMTQNELEEFMEDSRWTRNSILKREEKIINFAVDHWDPRKIE